MNAFKRNLVLAVCFTAPFLGLTVPALRYQNHVAQERRNHDLRDAIKSDDLRGVVVALRQGANPNCREVARDRRSLWQKALQLFRPPVSDGEPLRSALTIAVNRPAREDLMQPDDRKLAILQALHDAGAKADGDAPERRSDLNALAPPETSEAGLIPPYWTRPDTSPAREGLQEFLAAEGMSAQACRWLGDVFLRADYYDAAARYYRAAQIWRPDDAQIGAALAQSLKLKYVTDAVTRLRTDKRKAIAARLYSEEPGRRLWVVCCADESKYRYDNAHLCLTLCAEQDDGFHLLSEFGGLYGGEAALSAARVTGKATPEIALEEHTNPGDSGDTTLSVFRVEANRLRRIFRLDSAGDAYLQAPRHNGHYEAVAEDDCVDQHPDRPRWYRTIYTFNGKTFVFARRVRDDKPCQ